MMDYGKGIMSMRVICVAYTYHNQSEICQCKSIILLKAKGPEDRLHRKSQY